MKNIYGITLSQLENYFEKNNYKKFKATQVFEWLYKKRVSSFDEMTNMKKTTIEELKNEFVFENIKIVDKKAGQDVIKYLFELKDKNLVEAVLMKHDYGNSLCVSTQVGCNMGCAFCESGRLKKIRNLETYEMVLQILKVEMDLNIRISHIVLMGIGEPFDNYDNVMNFIDIINSGKGIDIGARHITISTCGIIPKIKEFMENGKQINLAISLHAPDDEIRNKIMNINKAYPINDLIDVLKEYIKKTNRRVTFEYVMLKNINDTEQCAITLAKLIKNMNAYVNLIPYNETRHIAFNRSDNETILKFYDILKKNKINVTIRKEFGNKVNAACGQLRANHERRDK
ncbi:MAG: 23S rRNA (adenine(2503)-C(2))-methyltransferase RlmN [Bacilli bacterium]|nr:23S rRNA (adenine(2503)-C(2))-methyltransferase RlmN [Bacilli bacterium]